MIETVQRVVCDRCSTSGPVATASEDPVLLAAQSGWKVGLGDKDSGDLDGLDYCQICYPKEIEELRHITLIG